jgi:hypothetical protein
MPFYFFFKEIIKDFERNLQDMGSNFIENVQGYLSQCRDLENAHHERMLEIAIITLEKFVKNELDDEISEDLRNVCIILPVYSFTCIKQTN